MIYTIENISKKQIASLSEIQDKEMKKEKQRDNNLEIIFKTIEFTKSVRKFINPQHIKSDEKFNLSFSIDNPKIISEIAQIVKKNPLDSPKEIVSNYLILSANEFGFKTVESLIESLDFQIFS
ncbi:hypothetical protein ND856_19335 [Leptospira bandrabouensis]|uniref:hypothetical protein n=1 Tax=Leptospira bandrabouensis TaxID=2484903 RepID=UPI00223D2005|nr:hypothetical protein [Leptospira bandrabouensis]MCW7460448.1 hypothetical protein [Leptospira bandrabouensis]MCW7479462.1 hypothetical protein [Leptospira bandrabouensis]MCW7487143.1 hypothetical protein [Leptospira bandrabouensis]